MFDNTKESISSQNYNDVLKKYVTVFNFLTNIDFLPQTYQTINK